MTNRLSFETGRESAELRIRIQRAVKGTWGYDAKEFQVRWATRILNDHDVLVVAGTGGGKTVGFEIPTVCFSIERKITLVVSPLRSLIRQQVNDLKEVSMPAIGLYKDSDDMYPGVFKDIAQGKYWLDEKFREKIGLVVFDECHYAVDHVDGYRPAYKNIGALRTYLPGIPFTACTATLAPGKEKKLFALLGMREKRLMKIRESSNRENLFYAGAPIRKGMEDFAWLVPSDISTPDDIAKIPSTVVYCFGVAEAMGLARYLQSRLPGSPEFTSRVRVNGPEMRELQEENFRKGICRILVASEAWGVGVNYSCERIIIKGISNLDDVDQIVQRFGRAGRSVGSKGLCIVYPEPALVPANPTQVAARERRAELNRRRELLRKRNTDKENVPPLDADDSDASNTSRKTIEVKVYEDAQATTGKRKRIRRTQTDRIAHLPSGVYDCVLGTAKRNGIEVPCIRYALLDAMGDPMRHTAALTAGISSFCCCRCNPDAVHEHFEGVPEGIFFYSKKDPPPHLNKRTINPITWKRTKTAALEASIVSDLKNWRLQKVKELDSMSIIEQYLLPDASILALASHIIGIKESTTPNDLLSISKFHMPKSLLHAHGASLLA
ncbi:hypothetical protein AOL_s00081g266 [Orbilia oligospora ATCC 24927]|uniref:DNA 3'-5' helicase n=1 Tax=Arthrobotrys oligospora (strain ATCC 24927 / CBS 115.81 / DSM 1491) TaxID=756982 RepID=G1XFX3_ARTOA|nr:hypothetical protein AOL_s00081g266 [Orbilia oligospora ATCC 24927]EGX47939.1 hypothetical protein AOL_s00081g266 [Orbilia oligospora ATCC 24927]